MRDTMRDTIRHTVPHTVVRALSAGAALASTAAIHAQEVSITGGTATLTYDLPVLLANSPLAGFNAVFGITESYDGKALFINIQHPGEDTAAANIASPTSSWPYSTANGNPATATTAKIARPRSATIVLTRIDGGVIGTDFTLS